MEGSFYSILLRNVKITHTDLEVIKLDYVAERETDLSGTLQNN